MDKSPPSNGSTEFTGDRKFGDAGAANDSNFAPVDSGVNSPPASLRSTAIVASCHRIAEAPPNPPVAESAFTDFVITPGSLAEFGLQRDNIAARPTGAIAAGSAAAPYPDPLDHHVTLLERTADRLGAPRDRPRVGPVITTLAAVVQYLKGEIKGAEQVEATLASLASPARLSAAPGAARNSLSKRRGRHLLYAVLVELSERIEAKHPIDEQVGQILAAWSLRALLSGWLPAPDSLANVRAVLVRPDSAAARSWSARGRRRCLDMALSSLEKCIEQHPVDARDLGLQPPEVRDEPVLSPVEHFNLLFCKRFNALQTNSSRRAAGGVGGHGTLSEQGLADAGSELLEGVLAGDRQALLRYLLVMSHLSDKVINLLPIVRGKKDPETALAWLAIDDETYCYRLFNLARRGAKPSACRVDRFEVTEQVVRLRLSPVAGKMFRQFDACRDAPVANVGELLGPLSCSPRSGVVGKKAYRRTARRIQESLPVLLMENGGNRWPIMFATSSPFLASVGRHSYGCCPLIAIQAEFDKAHVLLRWPARSVQVGNVLIGSQVTPTTAATRALINHLLLRAERNWEGLVDLTAVIRSLRAVAPWMACLLALSLALRKRLVYAVPQAPLIEGVEVEFDDKHVHVMESYALPVCALLQRAAKAYASMLDRAIEVLSGAEDAESYEFAQALRSFRATSSTTLVVDVDAAGRPVAAGYRTWHDAAPESRRLPGNFARQFWPLHGLLKGLPQRLLDVLMRHQLADLHLGGRTSTAIKRHVRARLAQMLDEVIKGLGLDLPACLRSFE